MNNLHRELSQVLNRHNIDGLLETPDHVLATMIVKHLDALGLVIAERKRLSLNIFNEAADTIILPGESIQEPATETVNVGGCRGQIEVPKTERKC